MAENGSVHSHSRSKSHSPRDGRSPSPSPSHSSPSMNNIAIMPLDEREIEHRESLTRHPSTLLEKQSTAASSSSELSRRRTVENVISTIRSREPGQTATFTHPLSHVKTAEDVIVGFDGPDDPYMPLNWTFGKKATTTVLYGLTTMGMFQGGYISASLCTC